MIIWILMISFGKQKEFLESVMFEQTGQKYPDSGSLGISKGRSKGVS